MGLPAQEFYSSRSYKILILYLPRKAFTLFVYVSDHWNLMDTTVLSTLYMTPRKNPLVALVFSSPSDCLPHGTPQDHLVWLSMVRSAPGRLAKKGCGDGADLTSGMSFMPMKLSPNQRGNMGLWVPPNHPLTLSETVKQCPGLCSDLCHMQNLQFYLCSKHFQIPPFTSSLFRRPLIKPTLSLTVIHQHGPKPALARMFEWTVSKLSIQAQRIKTFCIMEGQLENEVCLSR